MYFSLELFLIDSRLISLFPLEFYIINDGTKAARLHRLPSITRHLFTPHHPLPFLRPTCKLHQTLLIFVILLGCLLLDIGRRHALRWAKSYLMHVNRTVTPYVNTFYFGTSIIFFVYFHTWFSMSHNGHVRCHPNFPFLD